MTVKDQLREWMLKHTTAVGFGYSSAKCFTFEWAKTNYLEGYMLHIDILVENERVVLSGDSFGVTVCDFHDLPTVLEAVERVLPREERDG